VRTARHRDPTAIAPHHFHDHDGCLRRRRTGPWQYHRRCHWTANKEVRSKIQSPSYSFIMVSMVR
jgi:hypothetical protein